MVAIGVMLTKDGVCVIFIIIYIIDLYYIYIIILERICVYNIYQMADGH